MDIKNLKDSFDYSNAEKVLSVKNLEISFKTDHGIVRAVRGVSFDLYKGETLCIVGESGSGKSVTNKAIMGISASNAVIDNGQIIYEGEDLVRVSEDDFHRIRGNKIGMIFQDPLSALNPLVRVGKQITESMLINSDILKKEYNDLILTDLTALRNVQANSVYDLSKNKNEINKNKRVVSKYISLTKAVNNSNNKNVEESKVELAKLLETYAAYIAGVNIKANNEITRLEELVEKDTKKMEAHKKQEEVVEGVPTALRVLKRENRIKESLKEIEIFKKIRDANLKSYDLIEGLNIYNTLLLDRKALVKESVKVQTPTLSQILKLRKVWAKGVVKEHKARLIEERDYKLESQDADLEANSNEIEAFIERNGKEEYNRIQKIIRYNKKGLKKQEKLDNKFKDNTLSGLDNTRFEPKSFENEEFEKIYNERTAILNNIEQIKVDYLKQTKITKAEAKKAALKVMKEVGIPLPERRFYQYPFEFSGGMRQRMVIAIALMANPDILICDEPTTALDVTIQGQILELINDLKKTRNLSCIFITHDLGVVANMADRVAVMYAGKIVEYGKVNEVFFDPKHPYTWALLSSIPDVDSKEKLDAIQGTPPDMIYPPVGDAFALRSKYAMSIDFKYEPPFFKVSDTHYAATWLLHPDAPKVEMPRIVTERIKNSLKQYNEKGGK